MPLPLRYGVLRFATQNSTIQYSAFGEIRASSGITPTEFRYMKSPSEAKGTGQLRQAEMGLYYYVARWYDPALAHFAQADTIVPNAGDSAAYDRFAYVRNNPIKYNDPSGHDVGCAGNNASECSINGVLKPETIIKRTYTITPVVQYIYTEIIKNSKSETVKRMKDSNASLLKKPAAYSLWIEKVDSGHDWDHKEKIRNMEDAANRPMDFQVAGTRSYQFDTWSNIHYGFVGKVAGFSDDELSQGAGLAQFWSDLKRWNNDYLRKSFPTPDKSATGFSGYDSIEDRAAITIGIDLYDYYGMDLRPEDIIWAIEQSGALVVGQSGKTK